MKFQMPDGLIIDTDNYDLFVFTDYECLTNTPFRDHQPLAMRPGRVEMLSALRRERRGVNPLYGIAANKGGVAFGLETEESARNEVEWIARQIAAIWEACFGHSSPKAGYEQYASSAYLAFRKPAPGMLLRLMERAGVDRKRTLMIGSRIEDRLAARNARCNFMWERRFFAEAERYIVQTAPAATVDDFNPFDAEEI